ncbi:uncharacterized protein [Diabrotica undecimpunctata]|uniref:uncharacterized protein n=1 Tax=Diabrotica undecimpunctata TaxID=50387 RepID=UPI003B63B4CA
MIRSKLKFILLILVTFKGGLSSGLRCYVCSDGSDMPCINFDSEKEKYVQQCGASQKGCHLKVEGDKKIRSCFEKKIDDCKVANEVEYCFCSTDLCNSGKGKFSSITDDEDLIEGSGTRVIFDVSKEKELETQPKQNVTVTYVHSGGFSMKASQYVAIVVINLIFCI